MTKKTKITLSGKKTETLSSRQKSNPRTFSKISKIELPDYVAELKQLEADSHRPFQLLNPEMLKDHGDPTDPKNLENYPKWIDPVTKRECHGRIVSVKWLETGRTKIKGVVKETVRPVYIKPGELMNANKKLKESSARKKNLVENWENSFATGGDGGLGGLPLGDVVQYPPGPFTRQLYLQAMWDMQARCFEIFNHYGIAKSAVNTISYFVIGDGIKVHFEDEDAQAVWDEFAERTHLDRDLQMYCMMLSVNGEQFFHLPAISVDGEKGYTDLLSVDPSTVWEIITVPKDIRKIKTYWVQYATQYQLYTVGGVEMADYVIEQLDPTEVIHVKINVQKNEKRGRSDLLASLSDMKMLQDIMRYRSVRVINEAALVFDQKITGQDTDVSQIAGLQTDFLGAGTTYTHNESSEMEIKSATMSATSKSGFHDEMLAQIGTGAGSMPAEFVGGGSGSNRANALTKTEPSYKFFRSRQKKLEYTIKDIAKLVVGNWNDAKKLNLSAKCEVIFPEIAPEDRKDKLANIVLMESQEYWNHEKAATTAAKEMDDTSYDYEAAQEAIKQERLEDPQLAFLFQPQAPGAIGGVENPGAAATNTNAPKGPLSPAPKLGSPAPTSQYKNNSMGLGSSVKKSIKTQMKQSEAKAELHHTKKAGHKMVANGFRGRTNHTVKASEEAMGSGSMPALMRATKELYVKESEALKKHSYSKVDWKETAPPGWEDTVKHMKKSGAVDNPFALAWYMDSQGYTPHK